jgi:hypothetical protein
MSAAPKDASALAAEVRHFHNCLFRQQPDEVTITRYEAAHRELFPENSSSPEIATIVSRKLDAEAIEFALRRHGRGHELTSKLQIVCYLAEPRRTHLRQFVNLKESRPHAWAALAAATLGAVWKLGKGEYAIRRHGLL